MNIETLWVEGFGDGSIYIFVKKSLELSTMLKETLTHRQSFQSCSNAFGNTFIKEHL